jgi:hypothetical protein
MFVINRRERSPLQTGLILITVAGLAIDAIVHLAKASIYDANKTSVVTQGDLFRIEAALAILAALALVIHPRRWTALIAFLVSAGGAALVTLYRYVSLGKLGPIPQMYENTWTPPYANPWKLLSLWAEVAAAVASLILFFVLHAQARHATVTADSGTTTPVR